MRNFEFTYNGQTTQVEMSQRGEYATFTEGGRSWIVTPEMVDSWKLSIFLDDVKYYEAYARAGKAAFFKGS